MNQIVIGAAFPFMVAVVIYAASGFRARLGLLVGAPLFMMLGSIWAVVPDLPRLWGDRALYDRLSRDPRMNIFFFHYTIDQIETGSRWWFFVLLLMFGTLLFMAWRELLIAEQWHKGSSHGR